MTRYAQPCLDVKGISGTLGLSSQCANRSVDFMDCDYSYLVLTGRQLEWLL